MKRKLTAFILSGAVCLSAVSGTMLRTDSYVCGATVMYATLQKLEITNQKDTIAIGESVQLIPVWGNGAKSEITWSSDNDNAASVDETGKVTGTGEGTATITASPAEQKTPVTITITVSKNTKKSEYIGTSELKLGDKLHEYDTLHYDDKNIGSCANIVNSKGSYDVAFISEKDYTLPFDAEVVGFDGLTVYLAPDIDGVTYLDARTLKVGDTIDRRAVLLCYDYHTNKRVLPVFLPEYYDKYIGSGEITVKDIDHEKKTITLESQQESLEKYTKSYEALKSARAVVFEGNRALVKVPVIVKKDGCVIEPGKIEYELTGTADASCKSGSCINSISYDENYAMGYCLITADSPGIVRLYAHGAECLITYMNLTVDENVNFKEEYTTEKPVPTGDINGSGKAEVSDVITLKKWLLNTSDIKLRDWKMGDLNDDGKLDVTDLLMMKKKVLVSEVPDKMPYIRDASGQITSKMKNMIWDDLKTKYPDADFTDFTFKYVPNASFLGFPNGYFKIYYKDVLLNGYGGVNKDEIVFATIHSNKNVLTHTEINFVVDPMLYTEVDTDAKCLSKEEIASKYEYYQEPEKTIYIDRHSETLRLAYRVENINGLEEYIVDAFTGEEIEHIPYYVI